ncbi:MAG: hypothetical protein ACQEXJ_18300 [Myxococcota bacterium]
MTVRMRWLAMLAAAMLLACDGDDGGDGGSPDVVGDDTAGDAESDVADDTDAGPTCPDEVAPPDPVDMAQKKFAMSLFHFNIQYVIGGLEYVDDDGDKQILTNLPAAEGWTDAKLHDWIIEETFEPILDIYLDHPDWGVDIEMQAYMVEVMAERHPDVLAKLRELAWAGQVELISFHNDAQLFLAFPREDQRRSIARTRQVFEDHCLPLSGVVFNQEGQAGEGRQRMLLEEGYEVGVHPKNLWKYVRHGETPWPWYESEGGTLIVGPGGVAPDSGIEVVWDFFDDGELRAVAEGISPYTPFLGDADEQRLAEFEAQLAQREEDGWAVTTIGDYVRHLDAQGVEKKPAPPLLDGTWQPTSTTTSIHRWLGGASQAFPAAEEDNEVRAGNARARMHVEATQILLDEVKAQGVAPEGFDERMATLWDDVFEAEVSDASGVNPWRGEVVYVLRLNQRIIEEAEAMRVDLLEALGTPHAAVDLRDDSVTPMTDIPMPEPPPPADAPLEVDVVAEGRDPQVSWFEMGESRYQLQVQIDDSLDAPECEDCDYRHIEVTFPRTEDMIRYSPGLIEDEVREYPFDAFSFEVGEVWLPLANGLIGLGDGWWAIKHVRTNHHGVRLAPADPFIQFVDENIHREDPATWIFEVFQGSAEDALDLANRINIDPVVYY